LLLQKENVVCTMHASPSIAVRWKLPPTRALLWVWRNSAVGASARMGDPSLAQADVGSRPRALQARHFLPNASNFFFFAKAVY
jgi:hypothetical protein